MLVVAAAVLRKDAIGFAVGLYVRSLSGVAFSGPTGPTRLTLSLKVFRLGHAAGCSSGWDLVRQSFDAVRAVEKSTT